MAKVKGITIELGLSDRSVQKLRAIAKHCEALADELEVIDNAWQCECGCTEYVDEGFINSEVIYTKRICNNCGAAYVIDNDLPTRLEGSE